MKTRTIAKSLVAVGAVLASLAAVEALLRWLDSYQLISIALRSRVTQVPALAPAAGTSPDVQYLARIPVARGVDRRRGADKRDPDHARRAIQRDVVTAPAEVVRDEPACRVDVREMAVCWIRRIIRRIEIEEIVERRQFTSTRGSTDLLLQVAMVE